MLAQKFSRSNGGSILAQLFLVLALALPASAQTPTFRTYTQRDGLAGDYVTSIAFAPDGATWIGTARGATRVQDKYWVSYTAANGLGNSWVSGVAIAADGKTYLATQGGGLALFDGANRKTYTTSNSTIPSNYLTAVVVDRQGRVWVGTYGAGVGRLENDQWSKFSFANNYITALALDANGAPWIATGDGVFIFDGKQWVRLTQATGLTSSRVNALAIGRDGRVWFGTDNGVTVYDGKTYRAYRQADGLPDNLVRALALDAQNRVWVGTPRGVAALDAGKWKTYTRADGLAADTITALALDRQGNPWIGTTHGLNVLSATALQPATLLPVVLVHGWHTADSDELDDTEFEFLRRYLERDGFTVFYAQGISPYKTLLQNAATLRDRIASVKAQTGAPRVDVIAFSMGGLNTRAYLESTLYQNDVRRAIILGTPQAGVRMWYPLLTREIEDRPTEPSVIELSPEYAALFNRTHTPRATVPYDLLIGDARTQTGLDLLKNFPANDGLIDVWSAHALAGPQVRRVLDTDLHAWNPAPLPFTLTSYLYPEQTYVRFIRNALRDPDSRPIGFAAPAVEPLAPRNTTPLLVDTLRAGETITRTIALDANRAARFIARWDRGDIELRLRAPDGTRFTPDAPREATFLQTDIASFASYAITRTITGTWSLGIARRDQGSEPARVTTYVDLDADLRLDAATDRAMYPLGASVIISATLANRAPNADVRAKITWLGDGKQPRGASTEMTLLSEGAPGNYANVFTDATRGGYYLVRVTARGAGYARERQTLFAVAPKTAAFAGGARARLEQGALAIETNVVAERAGEFALAAVLHNPRGELVLALTAPLTLNAGPQIASISIPSRDLRARGLDGPYTVSLILLDANWTAIQVDELPNALTTDAYRVTDFAE